MELAVLGICAAFCAVLAWRLLRYGGTPTEEASARLVRKSHAPARMQVQGVGLARHTTHTSARHTLTFELPDGRRADVNVSAHVYERLREGKLQVIQFQTSRLDASSVRITGVR